MEQNGTARSVLFESVITIIFANDFIREDNEMPVGAVDPDKVYVATRIPSRASQRFRNALCLLFAHRRTPNSNSPTVFHVGYYTL